MESTFSQIGTLRSCHRTLMFSKQNMHPYMYTYPYMYPHTSIQVCVLPIRMDVCVQRYISCIFLFTIYKICTYKINFREHKTTEIGVEIVSLFSSTQNTFFVSLKFCQYEVLSSIKFQRNCCVVYSTFISNIRQKIFWGKVH